MIDSDLDKSVDVHRLDPDESGNGESFALHIENLPAHIQPLDESFATDIEGNYGKDYLMFCEQADILQGDRIIDGANVYLVVGFEQYNFMDDNHMEVRIRRFNP